MTLHAPFVHAQVKRRSTVRGLRALERRVLEDRWHTADPDPTAQHASPKGAATPRADAPEAEALPRAEAPAPCASRDRGVLRPDSALEATG